MKKFKIMIRIPIMIDMEAENEGEAREEVINALIHANKITACEPFDIEIIEVEK